jgi:flagellar hook-basal body complex protein FliE
MIENKIVPNMNIFSNIHNSMPIDDFSKKGFGVSKLQENNQTSFKDVLSGLVSNLNNDIEKPDQLLNAQMMGNKEVDIHDIMTAAAKAEVGVNLATQVTTKVIAAYNAVMNISI